MKKDWKAVTTHGELRSVLAVMADGPTQVAVATEGTWDDIRLMAAAPDMLACLDELVAQWDAENDRFLLEPLGIQWARDILAAQAAPIKP